MDHEHARRVLPSARRTGRSRSSQELPSHYIRRQIHATFQQDAVAIHNIPLTGADCLLWGNDYPHPESTYPNSNKVLDEVLRRLPGRPLRRKWSGATPSGSSDSPRRCGRRGPEAPQIPTRIRIGDPCECRVIHESVSKLGGPSMTIASIADIVRTHARERPDDPVHRVRGPHDHVRRARRRSSQLANALRGRRRRRRRPRRVPRQERPRVLRGHVRAREAQRRHRRGQLAAGADRDRADHQRRHGQGADRRPGVRRPRREDRADLDDGVDDRRHRWPRSLATTTRRSSARTTPTDPRRRAPRRRRRVPAVHVGHDRAAQGRDAHERQLLQRRDERHRRRGSSRPDSVNLAVMPMFHIAGSGWSMVGPVPRLPHGPAPRRRSRAHPRGRSPSSA